MSVLQWEDRFSIGIAEVDHEHREMIQLINDLHAAMGQIAPLSREPKAQRHDQRQDDEGQKGQVGQQIGAPGQANHVAQARAGRPCGRSGHHELERRALG